MAGQPQIDLPSDLSCTFDWPKTGGKEKDAVLADSEQSIKAVDLAIVNQDALDKAYLYCYEGEAAAGTEEFIQNYVNHKAGLTRTYHFYLPEADVDTDGTASFSRCEDQSMESVKYLKYGKVNKTPVPKKSYVFYNIQLCEREKNFWVITKVMSQSESDKCHP